MSYSHLSINFLRYTTGFIFIWFGVLKMFNASPSLDILKNSLPQAFGESQIFFFAIAFLEILIGIGLFLKRTYRFSALVMIILLTLVTLSTLFTQGFEPRFPILSLAGEYALKNLAIIAAAVAILSGKSKTVEENPTSHQSAQLRK